MSTTETTEDEGITLQELQLAARNHGMPLEALVHDLTPVGLHYLLIHFDIPMVDEASWRLTVGGSVSTPLELSLGELQAMPTVTLPVTMECAGNGRARLAPRPLSQPWLVEAVGTAEWTGTPLGPLLDRAGLLDGALEVVFSGLDRGVQGEIEQQYERSLPLAEAMRPDVLLAYAMNGKPLLPQHGFPLRLLVPGWYGMTSVKWLHSITVTGEAFEGYQQAVAYRVQRSEDDEPGEPVTRIQPRSLMVPPGIPDFFSRVRYLRPGPCPLTGRAWSGWGPVVRVEVSTSGGAGWAEARLGPPAGERAWTPWRFAWDATEPGEYELCCRATDAAGNVQPDDQPWNVQGMANNMIQRVPVTVGEPPWGSA